MSFYETLGVSKDVNESELKKAYRTLSLKYHPDRNTDSDTTAKFQEISEAYETLSDPEKRKDYDNGGPSMPEGFHNMNDIFSMMFGQQQGVRMQHAMPGMGPGIHVFHGQSPFDQSPFGHNPFSGQSIHQMFNQMQKPPPIIQTIHLSLDQCYHGCEIQVDIERWIIMSNMKISEMDTIPVTIPPGIDERVVIVITEKGNMINEQCKGEVKLTIQIEPHSTFQRSGTDLIYNKTISLKESLCGFTFDILHLNGKLLSLNNNTNITIIKPGHKKTIPNLGMKQNNTIGNLIIEFNVAFPDVLTPDQITVLSAIL